jgi:hypothetical protein
MLTVEVCVKASNCLTTAVPKTPESPHVVPVTSHHSFAIYVPAFLPGFSAFGLFLGFAFTFRVLHETGQFRESNDATDVSVVPLRADGRKSGR